MQRDARAASARPIAIHLAAHPRVERTAVVTVNAHVDAGFGEQSDGGERIDPGNRIEFGLRVCVGGGGFGDLNSTTAWLLIRASHTDDDALVQRDDGSWLVDAMMSFADAVGLRPDESEQDTRRFVVARFGRLPRVADRMETISRSSI